MEKFEELKKKIQCQKCDKPYNELEKVWIHIVCKHHVCRSCDNTALLDVCPVCNCATAYARHSLMEDFLTTLKGFEASIVKISASETSLRAENTILKEKLSMLEASKESHYKCAECEKIDYEQDMQLCKNCYGLKFEDLEDVKRKGLCPACAIKKHMRNGHQVVDFYPYLSAYKFLSHSSNIDSKSEEYKTAQNLLNDTFNRFNALSINVFENYDSLTDMARRSKNTKTQIEIFENMEKFMDESKSINVETDSEVKKCVTLLEANLKKIKEWFESKMGNCVDESKVIKIENSEGSDDSEID